MIWLIRISKEEEVDLSSVKQILWKSSHLKGQSFQPQIVICLLAWLDLNFEIKVSNWL